MTMLASKLKFEQDWYKRLIQNGNEKVVLAEFIRTNFLEEKVDSFLEVGMGVEPIFASILSNKVTDYFIVEKEERQHLQLSENVHFTQGDFEELQLEDKFDLILFSHVIYYFNDLKKSVYNSMRLLSNQGKIIFVVNGPNNDYGRLKEAFSKITNSECNFTYFKIKDILRDFKYKEYSLETNLKFTTHEQLYENIRLFFDLFPNEFNCHKNEIIAWMSHNILNGRLNMDQKILVVENTNDFKD